jgi:glutamate--cysteine ligase regulatory subunit
MGGASSAPAQISFKSNVELTAGIRSNMDWHRKKAQSESNPSSDADSASKRTYESWTSKSGDDVYVPSWTLTSGLIEERQAYDITVKLFYLPNMPAITRGQHARDAIDFVLRELRVTSVDLLIVSFHGITFDADDESPSSSSSSDYGEDAAPRHKSVDTEEFQSVIQTWRALEAMQQSGIVHNIGLAEFGTTRLSRLLSEAKVRPAVDQINVRDCCVVPKPLILLARREKIELLTHNDCTDILPSGTIRELLSADEVGVLRTSPQCKGDDQVGLRGTVVGEWVVKYTAVVRDRGVVENKGYFAAAELQG